MIACTHPTPAVIMRVLVIDDEEVDRWIVERSILFSFPKFEIFHASTVEQAFSLVKSRILPDITILDLHMYPDSGFYFLDNIRNMRIQYFPIIVLTNSLNISDRERALEHPWVEDCLEKPMTKKLFYSIMERMKLKSRLLDINDE